MNKFILILFLSTVYFKAQVNPILKKAIFYTVRVTFEDSIYLDNPYRKSFKSYVANTKWDSINYPTILNFEGKFKNDRISVYDLGEKDIFDLKEPQLKKIIFFDNVTTDKLSGSAGVSFIINQKKKKNSFLIQLSDGNSIIISASENYHFINLYFNREKKYWHIIYSNYISIGT
ncbi:hypothetical protein ODZ84_01840 [Chryseobacterium fluminis]|uniref:hypothetical protein n=1 Tax=Chryseobacterium fluminis TaxID=2983606 RepID=UPI00224E0A77|nr:hypothetical protein [Chryseobacterium sp. MMS21-Ot14]UZT98336.1 hypothetical protein ODZ84_01840 [Chryseobacterium sp. MMS21-Ot14]